jgi:hypothetical protein
VQVTIAAGEIGDDLEHEDDQGEGRRPEYQRSNGGRKLVSPRPTKACPTTRRTNRSVNVPSRTG